MPDENSTGSVQSTQSSTQSGDDYVLDFGDLGENNGAGSGSVKTGGSDDNDTSDNNSNDGLLLEEGNSEGEENLDNEESLNEPEMIDNEDVGTSQDDFNFSLNLDGNNEELLSEDKTESEVTTGGEENTDNNEPLEDSKISFEEEHTDNSEDFSQSDDLFESSTDEYNQDNDNSLDNTDNDSIQDAQDNYATDNYDLQPDSEATENNDTQENYEEDSNLEFNNTSDEQNILQNSNEEEILDNNDYNTSGEDYGLDNDSTNDSYDDKSTEIYDNESDYNSESDNMPQVEEENPETSENNFFKSESDEESEGVSSEEGNSLNFSEPTENEVNLSDDINYTQDAINTISVENSEEKEDNNLFDTQFTESESSENEVGGEENYQINDEDNQNTSYFSEDTGSSYDNENSTQNDEATNNLQTEETPLGNIELNSAEDMPENNLQDSSNVFSQEYENIDEMNGKNESLDSVVNENVLNENVGEQVIKPGTLDEEYAMNNDSTVNNPESAINQSDSYQIQDEQPQISNNVSVSEGQETIATTGGNSEDAEKDLPQFNIQNEAAPSQPNNIEVKSTLSLDQILDSEVPGNSNIINNSNIAPQNTSNSGGFNSKKLITALVGVGVFAVLGVLAYVELPTLMGGKEAVDTGSVGGTVYEDDNPSIGEDLSEDHSSAIEDENQGDVQEIEDVDNPEPNDPLPFIEFPDVDIDGDEDENDGSDIGQGDGPVPYQQERTDENEDDESLLEDIEISISSFKSQGEIYYSAGQEMLDKQIIKYSLQLINACEKYQQQIENGEGIDQESFSSFKTSANQIVSKIDTYNNGGEEIEVIQANLDDSSYFEGKDELKDYIYSR